MADIEASKIKDATAWLNRSKESDAAVAAANAGKNAVKAKEAQPAVLPKPPKPAEPAPAAEPAMPAMLVVVKGRPRVAINGVVFPLLEGALIDPSCYGAHGIAILQQQGVVFAPAG